MTALEPAWARAIRANIVERNARERYAFESMISSYTGVHRQLYELRRLADRSTFHEGDEVQEPVDATTTPEQTEAPSNTQMQILDLRSQLARVAQEKVDAISNANRKVYLLERRHQEDSELLIKKEELSAKAKADADSLRLQVNELRAYIESLRGTMAQAAKAHQQVVETNAQLQNTIQSLKNERRDNILEIQQLKNQIVMLGGEGAQDMKTGEGDSTSTGHWMQSLTAFGDERALFQNVAWDARINVIIPSTRKLYIQAHRGIAPVSRYFGAQVILTGGADGLVMLWKANSSTGQRMNILRGPKEAITSLAISQDKGSFVAGSADGRAYLWGSTTSPLHIFTGQNKRIDGVCFLSPSLVITGGDNTIKIWDLQKEGVCVRTTNCTSRVLSVAAAATSSMYASTHLDNVVRLWSDTHELIAGGELSIHTRRVTCIEFFSDQLLLTNSWSGELALTDLRTKEVKHRYTGTTQEPYRNSSEWTRCAFSPDATYVIAGDDKGRIFVWNTNTTQLVKIIRLPIEVARPASVLGIDWNPNGRQLCSVDSNGCLSIWEDPITRDKSGDQKGR